MWLEVRDKVIIGIHTEEMGAREGSTFVNVESETDYSSIGKWYTKTKGVHDPVLTKTQLSAEQKAKEIQDAKYYLSQTDYVVTKISEAMVIGDEELRLKLLEEYADVLIKRRESRELVG